MQKNTFFRRAAALLLTAVLAVSAALPGLAVYEMPIQTANEGESVYLFNADIDKPILEQNIDQQRYIASLTKMMTALLFLESGKDLNAEITIPTSLTQEFKDIQNANGSTMNLRIGETVRRIDLLYGLLVASANDAASVIASDVADGSLPNFVAMMNQKAQELGCTSTSFTCVHGLYDYGNVSSAHDLALIASACAANETYMKAANTLSYTLPATNKHAAERTITHTNSMMNESRGGAQYSPYVRGVKTGATNTGRNLVSTATKDAYSYTLVTLNAPRYYENGDEITDNQSFVDAKQLYTWAFNNYAVRTVMKTSTPQGEVKVELAKDKDTIPVYPAEDVTYLMHGDIDTSSIQRVLTLPDSIDAPVAEGQVLGTMEVKLDDVTIATVDLVAGETLERSSWLEFLRKVKGFFSSVWFKLAIVVVLLLIAAYIVFAILYNNRKRRRRKAKRRF